ncbi:MAG TPA: lipopolysaccharide core heptose(I) kinase RfaP [Pseudomonadales bacterium]|nr:lipopolysaccharide core heptose(I) kinase RfaP [Pseudomonadales bacterium]
MKLFLTEQWQKAWQGKDPFAEVQHLQGKIYRSKEGRRTLRFERDGKSFFLKLHQGIGWREIFKNLVQGRLPVLGAANEYRACLRLAALGVDTMVPVAFGERGLNPARQVSFLVTEDLSNTISLEDYCKPWIHSPPSLREKRAVIRKLAQISKTLHENGVNHRDYYLCHFLRADNGEPFAVDNPLFLIDLHRAQLRDHTPMRWLVKDIAGLFYSAFDLPLTRRDLLCFLSVYRREWMQNDAPQLWPVIKRAVALYQKDFGKNPPAHILSILKQESSR